ncbi:MAG: 3-hydroxyacyl-ACP dehydratase FabZ [Lawsonibacter sp.]
MEFNIDQIEALLPHRYPFLLVDKITECIPGQRAKGIKCVTANEPFFQGHFPGFKVMPGVLIIEALAQVGAVAILTEEGNRGKLALFGGIKNARFKQQVHPGDVLELECELTARRGPVGFGTAIAKVNGKTACKAELTFALTEQPTTSCSAEENLL